MATPVRTSDTSSSCCNNNNGLINHCSTSGMLSSTDSSISRWASNIRKIIPDDNASPEDYETLLAESMKNFTFDQIQHEQELLHGVADETDLPESTINELLSSLQEHLNRTKTGTAYETAEQRSQAYTCNRDLQMAFLRANRFDPEESAGKIIKFFKYKQDLFGDECLVRDITRQDLDEDDVKFLLEGYLQYSPLRDRSGRKIFLELPGVRTKTAIRTELRGRFYFWANSIATMVEISRGTVTVAYLVSQYHDHLNGSGLVESFDLYNTVPLNTLGNHACTDSRFERIVTNALAAMMPHDLRVKTRIHYGSHTECQYLLASYGISRASLPFQGPNNDMDLSHHHSWFHQRVLQEQQQQTNSSSAKASVSRQGSMDVEGGRNENDVLCMGRVVKGVGNERLQSLARRYFPAYENGSVSDRRSIVHGIVDEIHSHGGRFLKPDDSASSAKTESISSQDEDQHVWKELSLDEKCAKVTQLFRNLRRSRRPRSSLASNSSARASSTSPIVVDSTQPEDVLFGQYVMNNPGNQRLRELVLGAAEEYNGTDRGKKKEIVLRIIANIHQSGGRFLMVREDLKWEIVSDKTVKERISKQFRNFRRRKR